VIGACLVQVLFNKPLIHVNQEANSQKKLKKNTLLLYL